MNTKKLMEKQGYRFIGNHSAVKTCEWTKKSLINKGSCYKQKFYWNKLMDYWPVPDCDDC